MEIKKTNEQADTGLTCVFYGQSGVGKTTLVGTLPEDEVFVLDIDKGLKVLKGKEINYVPVGSKLDYVQTVEDLLTTDHDYKYVFIDTLTELGNLELVNYAKNQSSGMPTLQNYGQLNMNLRDMMRSIRHLCDKGMTVIFLMHEEIYELRGNDTRSVLMPALREKIIVELQALCDVIGHVEISEKEETKGQRFIRLEPTSNVICKNRINDLKYCKADLSVLFGVEEEDEKEEVK